MRRKKPYVDDVDIFALHTGWKDDETFKGNIMVGDVVLDVSTKDVIRGIEILNAVDFFDALGVDESFLRTVDSAELRVDQRKDSCMVTLDLHNGGAVRTCRIALAWEAPLLSV